MATATEPKSTQPKITAKEFLAMDLGEGLHELVRGEIITMNPPEPAHGYICGNVVGILREFGRRTGHGYVAGNDSAVEISNDTVRGADVSYYSEARWPKARLSEGYAQVPPDVAVEVYSPSNRPGEMQEKVGDYLRAGVLVVWVLHPKRRTLTIYRHDDPTPAVLTEEATVEGIPELPGFRCDVAEFFN
jgi:Uma2 family endonuclease